MSIQENKQVSL
jgi:AcrR family transcriptional regulator